MDAILDLIEDKALKNIFEFILEAGKLKSVLRQTYMPDQNRFENSAEHSWHIILMAICLKDYAREEIQIEKVIKMIALHDLGEIYTGDTILYNQSAEQNNNEQEALSKMFSTLPPHIAQDFLNLWNEFEEGKTNEARYAKALDRFNPFLYQLQNGGESWKRHKIDLDSALDKNKHINDGSKELWNNYKILADAANEQGMFHLNKKKAD